MRFLPLVLIVTLAACARAPQPTPGPAPAPVHRPKGALIGMTANELTSLFGRPGFQVREGPGLKLQWSEAGCVLDAYLYPPESGGGVERVTHVDSRAPSGADFDLESCLSLVSR